MKTAALNIRLPAELRRQLEKLAENDSRKLSQLAVLALVRGADAMEREADVRAADDWIRRHPLKVKS